MKSYRYVCCPYCHCTGSHHHYSCPNYIPEYVQDCAICGQGIQKGENFIGGNRNFNTIYAHYDCLFGEPFDNIVDFFGGILHDE